MDIHALELIRESRTESHCSIAGRGAHDQCRNLLYLHLHVGGELRRHGRESNRRHPRGSNWPSWCPVAAAIRNLLRFVDAVGFYVIGAIVAGCSPWRQRLGDLSAGTMVVEEQFGALSRIVATALSVAVLCGAGWAVPRICAQQNAEQHAPYLNEVIVRVGRTEHAAYFRVARMQFDVQLDPRLDTTASR